MNKKIFLESHHIDNPYSGFGQFDYWLIKNMLKYNTEYDFVANAKKKKTIQNLGNGIRFKKYLGLHRYESFRIKEKFDLWHSLNQNTKIEPFHDLPYLLTIHDIIFIEKEESSNVDKKKLALLQEKIKRSKQIVYISEYAKSSTNKYLNIPESIPQVVIYNGNPIKSIKKIENVKTPSRLKKPFLFCIGQFLEMKNFHSLVGMLAMTKDYQLVIAGNNDKPYRNVVETEIKKFKMENRVILTGKISENEKHYYLQNCEAFVFPSLFEGFGLPPIEAMTYGKPIFLANRTSLPEIGGKYAFYWDSFDPESMAKTFEKGMDIFERSKEEYQKQLKARASNFSWERTAKNYLKIYNDLLI